MIESELRKRVVIESRSWIGTPFALGGRVKGKGGGVDCFTLIASVFHTLGVSPPWESEFYRGDWWCHDTKNSYLRTILKYAQEVPDGIIDRRPGNIVLARRKTGPSHKISTDWHGGIISDWPMVVHAFGMQVSEDNCLQHPAYQVAGGLAYFNPFVQLPKEKI